MTAGPFGRYDEEVEEVFRLVEGGQLLVPAGMPADVVVVADLSAAKSCAWEATYGDGFTWSDIRELEMAEIEKDALAVDGMEEVRSAIWEQAERMLQLLRGQLRGVHQELLDDIYSDMVNCAVTRAVRGKRAGFMEELFAVYRSGGWPCGREGAVPDRGRLLAYYSAGE